MRFIYLIISKNVGDAILVHLSWVNSRHKGRKTVQLSTVNLVGQDCTKNIQYDCKKTPDQIANKCLWPKVNIKKVTAG